MAPVREEGINEPLRDFSVIVGATSYALKKPR